VRRITPATVTVGVLFAFVGLVGAYVVRDALRVRTPPSDVVNNVLVSIADFPKDHVLTADDIGRKSLQRAQVPPGTIMERQSLVGRRLKDPINALTPFTGNLFYPTGGGPTLGDRLKPGYRAVTIEATPISAGLDGLVRPGDMVDILLTVDPNNRNQQLKGGTTMTLLQGIEVLAVERNIDRTAVPPSVNQNLSVTVAVTPNDANALVLAKDNGRLQLALRNPDETLASTTPKKWTLDELLGLEPPPDPTVEPQPKRFYAEIYRGTQHEDVEFEVEDEPTRKVPGASSQSSPPGRVRRGTYILPPNAQVPGRSRSDDSTRRGS